MTGWKSAVGAAVAAALASGPALAIRDLQGTNPDHLRIKCSSASWGYGAPLFLEACIAMGTADYCGASRSNTQEGTPIYAYDIDIPEHRNPRGVDHWFEYDVPSPLLSFEAGWAPDSPKSKKFGRAICLSKKRWATLPIDGPCPDVLPDPRKDQNAKYCEELGVSLAALEVDDPAALAALRRNRAFIFNKSAFLDSGLRLWTNGASYYTTTAGFDSGARRRDEPPAPGYRPVSDTGDSLVGVVLSDSLVWFVSNPVVLAGSPLLRLASLHLTPLVTYQLRDGSFMTTTRTLGERRVRVEGYVFKSEADVRGALPVLTRVFAGTPKPLIQYKGPGGKFALSVRPPGPGWTPGEVEGWVLRGGR